MGLFDETDIARAARSMIRDYGRRAADKAAEKASKAGMQDRNTASIVWKQIEREIRRLQSEFEPGC